MKSAHTLSLSLAVASFALLCPILSHASAVNTSQGAMSSSNATAAMQEAQSMVPAQASLKTALDARKLHSGQQFQAELKTTVHLKNGPELPRGTMLIGMVAHDSMKTAGTSRLALRFTRAKLKDGKVIPIKATIVGIVSRSDASDYMSDNSSSIWNNKTLQIDQLGVISGVDLHSNIASNNSGVFVTTKKDDVKLSSGSHLALAIAEQNSNHKGANGGA